MCTQQVARTTRLTKIGCNEPTNSFTHLLHPLPDGNRPLTACSFAIWPFYRRTCRPTWSLESHVWRKVALICLSIFATTLLAAPTLDTLLLKADSPLADAAAHADFNMPVQTQTTTPRHAKATTTAFAVLLPATCGVASAVDTPASVL